MHPYHRARVEEPASESDLLIVSSELPATAATRGRMLSRLPSVVGPVSIFAAAVVCHVLAVLPDARVEHLPVRKFLVKWDAGWYLDIARYGYPKSAAPRLAFFPGYPLVVRGVFRATPLNPTDALLFVAIASSALAMVVLWQLTERLCGSTVAYRTVALTAFAPAGFVLSMGYSEGLFLLFSSATLLMLVDRRWLLAGCFAAVACSTRPTGVAVAAACAVAAFVALRENRRDLRPLLAPALAGAGLLAFPLYTWRHNGDFFASQRQESRHWSGSFDFGVSTVRNLTKWVQHPLRDVNLLFFALAIAALIGGVVLLIRWRPPAPILAFGLGVAVLTVGSSLSNSTFRFVLVGTPLAMAFARVKRNNVFMVGLAISAAFFATLAAAATSTAYTP